MFQLILLASFIVSGQVLEASYDTELVCYKDECKGTWTNPIPSGEQWIRKGKQTETGCCSFGTGACDLCARACVATAKWVQEGRREKNVKGVAAFTQRNSGTEPGYLFSMVDETTCMRDITVVNQDMKTRTTVRTPVPLDNWDKVATWSFVNGGPGSFKDRKVQDKSCEWKPTGAQAYDGENCKSETDDRKIFKVSGDCKVQKNKDLNLNCVGSPNYPDDYEAEDENLCVVTMLKDATVKVGDSAGINEDCSPVVFAMMDEKESRHRDLRIIGIEYIPAEIKKGDYIKFGAPFHTCPGWQLCFDEPKGGSIEFMLEKAFGILENIIEDEIVTREEVGNFLLGQNSDLHLGFQDSFLTLKANAVFSVLESETDSDDVISKHDIDELHDAIANDATRRYQLVDELLGAIRLSEAEIEHVFDVLDRNGNDALNVRDLTHYVATHFVETDLPDDFETEVNEFIEEYLGQSTFTLSEVKSLVNAAFDCAHNQLGAVLDSLVEDQADLEQELERFIICIQGLTGFTSPLPGSGPPPITAPALPGLGAPPIPVKPEVPAVKPKTEVPAVKPKTEVPEVPAVKPLPGSPPPTPAPTPAVKPIPVKPEVPAEKPKPAEVPEVTATKPPTAVPAVKPKTAEKTGTKRCEEKQAQMKAFDVDLIDEDDLKNIEYDECEAKCEALDSCLGFVYQNNHRRVQCWLYSKVGYTKGTTDKNKSYTSCPLGPNYKPAAAAIKEKGSDGTEYALTSDTQACSKNGMATITDEATCRAACEALGKFSNAGDWNHSPNCFKVVSGFWKGECHWNKGRYSPTNTHADNRNVCINAAPKEAEVANKRLKQVNTALRLALEALAS